MFGNCIVEYNLEAVEIILYALYQYLQFQFRDNRIVRVLVSFCCIY